MSSELTVQALEALIKAHWSQADVDKSSTTVEKEQMSQFAAFLRAADPAVLALAADLLGTLARSDVNRNTLLSHTSAMSDAVAIVKASTGPLEPRQFAVRLIANLCFNSEEGRTQLLAAEGIASIVQLLSLDAPQALQRVLCGCIANMCSTNETVSNEASKFGVIPVLIQLLDSDAYDVQLMATRALGNISSTEHIVSLVKADSGLPKLVRLLKETDDDHGLASELVSAIAPQLELRSNSLEFLNEMDGFNLLLNVSQIYEEDEENEEEDSGKPAEYVEDALQKAIFDMIHDLAKNADTRPLFEEKHIIDKVVSIAIGQPRRRSTRRSFASRCLAELSVMDDMLDPLWPFHDNFVALSSDPLEYLAVRIHASIALGNTARSDKRCIELMESGAALKLLNVLDEPETNKSARLLTNVCSAIKNISVNAENKKKLIGMGALLRAAHLTRTAKEDIVIYGGITLMKSLLLVGSDAVNVVVNDLNIAPRLVELSSSDSKKREDHVIFEAARAVTTICLLGNDAAKRAALEANCVSSALRVLLQSKFAILHNEACRSLVKLLEYDPVVATESIVSSFDVLSALAAFLNSEEEPKPDNFQPSSAKDVPVLPFALKVFSLLVQSSAGLEAIRTSVANIRVALEQIISASKSAEWTSLANSILSKL